MYLDQLFLRPDSIQGALWNQRSGNGEKGHQSGVAVRPREFSTGRPTGRSCSHLFRPGSLRLSSYIFVLHGLDEFYDLHRRIRSISLGFGLWRSDERYLLGRVSGEKPAALSSGYLD